jgi:NAD(P)-dependent dehydrogenase (short-subunit alcohol dehydrogenase family)
MAFLGLLKKGNEKGNVEQTSQIIVTSSIAAFNKKAPGGWAYGQSKAAAVSAAKQLAVALPQWNIRYVVSSSVQH